jgi:uncharacterized protein (DUF302 family)
MAKSLIYAAALAIMLAGAAAPASAQNASEEHVTVHSIEGSFDDIRLDLENAILNRGLVIDYEAFVGEMLNRTAEDVGAETRVYTHAQTLQFCSAILSRRTMEADPINLAFCPYIVFVYEEAGAEGTIHVGYRRLPETGDEAGRAALSEVNALLDEIVRDAVGERATE